MTPGVVRHFDESPERARRKPSSLGASRVPLAALGSQVDYVPLRARGMESRAVQIRRQGAPGCPAKLLARPRKRTSHLSGNSPRHGIPSSPSEDAGDRTGDNRPPGVGSVAERPGEVGPGCTSEGDYTGSERSNRDRSADRSRQERHCPPVSAGRWAGSRKVTRIENTPRGLRLPRGFSRLG